MPEKVTSYGLKVTSEYCSYNYGAHNVRLVMLKRPLRKSNPAAAFLHITSLYEPVFNSKTYILTNNHKQDNNSNPCFHAHITPL
ncbi:hypothetical protein ATR76_06035 [Salmonella enterica subsp. enterica serovar Rubislaw]|nr:hypothetical protein [Salmonella enterica subsp. enterica serovar Rubislaw]ECX3423045.1 hypothetical protein [Salmonella enterica subsp. enterica serovar Rubislaw]ECX6379714.1 hypothetical protein [Salmonella enterica subsp. enterica serovar Rubislaw]